ncbi:ring-cleaving dioxygenase [Antarcticibacterium sp. 1MA-6-2]|uniref:ring-cleaving dioxygenase n=1 Tax=Antarcticibacterium sp. 1MA-6-2 TaxID=2908210 RepID=UPI001F18BB73|nr:ring-cleaving dioxygenase [Antarcticibacterium sp. 1MA-6-2]UJH91214.1 ring-cleaving dioxygenase [Antarcticibacterium sp. 1MA-6-2]
MKNKILGLHHITAIAGDAQKNYDFYTKVLGLRMVKKTVNFDDPKTYHFYFGDGIGSPGSILTFFPWPRVRQGKAGAGMATEIGYSVPEGSLEFWLERLDNNSVMRGEISEKFGEKYLNFKDPDGLNLELIVPGTTDERKPWETAEVNAEVALKGFHNVTLTLNDKKPTAEILTDIFDYEFRESEGNLHRYRTNAIDTAAIVDIREEKNASQGLNAKRYKSSRGL